MPTRITTIGWSAALLVGLAASAANAEGWGNLTGRFLYDGPIPTPKKLVITADKAFCEKHAPVDQELIVGKDKSLANVVVYLYTKQGQSVPIHEDYKDLEKEKVVLDNKNCLFSPYVATMWYKQPLELKNSDPVAHNTNVNFFTNDPFNIQIPAGASLTKKLATAERLPTKISCGSHPWMQSLLVVRPDPYVTITGADGKFTIKNLPEGEWTFQFWHEKWGYVAKVRIDGKKIAWKRGRPALSIEDGETLDIGVVSVNPDDYVKK